MEQTVTPEMRLVVSKALGNELRLRGYEETGQLHFSDYLTVIIHSELTKAEQSAHRTTTGEFVEMLRIESCEEETVNEYVALKPYFNLNDNTFTRVVLLRGLHRPERNREWMDISDPLSVQRNAALLQSIILLRKKARQERLLNEVLAYNDHGESDYNQSFRDPECVDLILDYPEHYETLINLILERGYRTGMGAFREMMAVKLPVMNNGVL